jgi:site-specific recombinase
MEPELLRLEPSLETHESPFVAQNLEMADYIEAYPEHWGKSIAADSDDRHLRVLFSQCQEVIERVRRNAARNGTSIRLTYQLQRLRQLLRRSEHLLDILAGLHSEVWSGVGLPANRQPVHPSGERRMPAQRSRQALAPEH